MGKNIIFADLQPISFDGDDEKVNKWIEEFSENVRKMPFGVTLSFKISFKEESNEKFKQNFKKTFDDFVHYSLQRPDIDIEIKEVFNKN